jgi:hypothetical protein
MAIAENICTSLEANHIRCWIAPRDIKPGLIYAEALVDALNSTKLLVLVFSSKSNESQHVLKEVERVVGKGIPIIPFRIEDINPSKSMEFFISANQWLDALTPPLEKYIACLTDTVINLLKEYKNSALATTSSSKKSHLR